MNMALMGINGGQGGGINAPWYMWHEILGLGPSVSLVFLLFGPFSLLLLCVREGDGDSLANRYEQWLVLHH